MTAPPDNSAPTNRRAFLAGAAAAVAAPTALAVLGAASPASAGVAPGCPSPGYAPVPPSALGPALNADGYFAGQINGNLYWVTDSFYQAMFLTTHDGVILVDAPPTIGHNLLRAIDAITSANGMPSTVTHLVYSHSHADHIGASSLFSADVVRIGHVENLRLLRRDDDPSRPPPTVTFEDRYVLEVGGEVLELAYHGPNVTPDNIFIHAPAHQTLMVVDILFPGWVPFKSLAIAQDIPGWIGAQDVAMSYPWTTLVGGHLGRLGTRADGLAQIQYIADLQASTRAAIASVDPTPSSTSTRRTPGRSSRPTSTPSPPKPPARSSPNTPECSPPPTSTPSSTPRQCSTRSGSTPATWDPSAITRRPGHPRTNHMRFAAKCRKNPENHTGQQL